MVSGYACSVETNMLGGMPRVVGRNETYLFDTPIAESG